MIHNPYATEIKLELDTLTLATQLMEECGELIAAVGHYIRANNMLNNPTKVDKDEAYRNLIEEMQDVVSVSRLLLSDSDWIKLINIDSYAKYERWSNRLKEGKEYETAKK